MKSKNIGILKCLQKSLRSGEHNGPPKSYIDKEPVEKGARRLFGDKELMFPPCVPTSTAPPLHDSTSVSAEKWYGGTAYMVFHPSSTNLASRQVSNPEINKWPTS